MESGFSSLLSYLGHVLVNTGLQVGILFAPLLVMALLMNLISGILTNIGVRIFGYHGFVYVFKWLGTSIHELGHAFFAILFGHRIKRIRLFDPKATGGSFGFVEHTWKKGNIYQETGNFFIGIGPVLFGSAALTGSAFLIFRFGLNDVNSVPVTPEIFSSSAALKSFGQGMMAGLTDLLRLILSGPGSNWPKILLFSYLLLSIGGSVALSPSDIRGAGAGFFFFLGALILFNLSTLWIGNFATIALTHGSIYLSGFYFLMTMTIGVNLIFAMLLWIVSLLTR